MITTSKGQLTPLQRAYLLGYQRAIARMRQELCDMKQDWDTEAAGLRDQAADLRDRVEGIERHYKQVMEVALALSERDPEARLH